MRLNAPTPVLKAYVQILLFNILASALDVGLTFPGPSYLLYGAAGTQGLARVLPLQVSETQFKLSYG